MLKSPPRSANDDPTERSMPPVMMTSPSPRLKMPNAPINRAVFCRLAGDRNRGLSAVTIAHNTTSSRKIATSFLFVIRTLTGLRVPRPCVSDDGFDIRVLARPTEHVARASGRRDQFRRIAGPAGRFDRRHSPAGGPSHGVDDFPDGMAAARTQVDRLARRARAKAFDRAQMSVRQGPSRGRNLEPPCRQASDSR